MSFKDKYTTVDVLDVAILIDKNTKEQNKVIISNDAMAIGEMIELLVNKMVR
jgi:hypothetical protein